MPGVADVLRRYGREYLDRFGQDLLPSHRRAIEDLLACRTEWRAARQSYLVPVHALSKLFRGLFRELVRQEQPDLAIPEAVWTKGWVVYCKPTVQGPEKVLNYLGRYVHRIALTNHRLLSIENGQVCFR